MKTAVIYAGNSQAYGNTYRVASQIAAMITDVHLLEAQNVTRAELEAHDLLILGTSTVGSGELHAHWLDSMECLRQANLRGRDFALFGLGDQIGHRTTFVDGMRHLFDTVQETGARHIGFWTNAGYQFQYSAALQGDSFIGLPIDEVNQQKLTQHRLQLWMLILQHQVQGAGLEIKKEYARSTRISCQYQHYRSSRGYLRVV